MIAREPFGRGPAGEALELFTLDNGGGLTARITNLGGIVTQLLAPGRSGERADVVLGFGSAGPYLGRHPYFGAIVGRVSGRVTPPWFELRGRRHELAANQPPHHLHGGVDGFDRRVWEPRVLGGAAGEALELRYRSPDGEEGYPGTLEVTVTYSVGADQALRIDIEAAADQATPVSLTHHGYFNLAGESAGHVGPHEVQVLADAFVEVDAGLAATGRILPVAGRECDLREPARLSDRLGSLGGRHGDAYVLRPGKGGPRLAARAFDPGSGRLLSVLTTEPLLQFYTGVGLDGTQVGKSGRPYGSFAGFCLECQGCGASLHHPGLPSVILEPGGVYRQTTLYRFGVLEAASLRSAPLT